MVSAAELIQHLRYLFLLYVSYGAPQEAALAVQQQERRELDQTKLADIGDRGLPVGIVINALHQGLPGAGEYLADYLIRDFNLLCTAAAGLAPGYINNLAQLGRFGVGQHSRTQDRQNRENYEADSSSRHFSSPCYLFE